MDQAHTPLMMTITMQLPARALKKTLKTMIDAAEWVDRTDPKLGVTPLIAAVMAYEDDSPELIKIAKLLIEHGASVNTRDSETGPGTTPLWMAAQVGKPNAVKFLLDNGARVDITPYTSRTTPVTIACMYGHVKCVAHLVKACEKSNSLHLVEIPNQVQNYTGAWCAVARGFPEIIGILAKVGADLRNAFPCWYHIARGTETTKNVDVGPKFLPVSHALNAAVFSFVHSSCAGCRTKKLKISKCSRCLMASYCSSKCQKADYKASHKIVCKRIRKGIDLYDEPAAIDEDGAIYSLPRQNREKIGFAEPFGGSDFDDQQHKEDECDAVWEYDNGPPGQEEWVRYPPNIEAAIERLMMMGSPKYMYRPSHPESEGKEEYSKSGRGYPPPGVSSCYIWFVDMIEREVYTGASRAVRRNGTFDTPKPDPEMKAMMEVLQRFTQNQ